MYEKSEKLTFEISIWVKKWQPNFFFQNLRACASVGYFFLGRAKNQANESSLS